MKKPQTLRSETGEVLEIKEAVVVGEDGEEIFDDRSDAPTASARTWQFGSSSSWPLFVFALIGALLMPVFFVAGISLIAFILVVFLIFRLLRVISRLL